MRARGYRGRFPAPEESRMQAKDLLLAGAWLALGITLILWDRFFQQGSG
jgi:cobalt/nickel transport system permease protein